MRLRSQILLFLFLFGLTPLLIAFAINVPLVLERLELFYHKAYLQNLRADFKDLDQHLARRRELIRLLAKLPEPGVILSDDEDKSISIEAARAQYTVWVNQLVWDQPDIISILFLDRNGQPTFWLDRHRDTLELEPSATLPELPNQTLIDSVHNLQPGGILTSSIRINYQSGESDPTRYMTLSLASPVYTPALPNNTQDTFDPVFGAIVLGIDIGGLSRIYRNTYWALQDGRYLAVSPAAKSGSTAFKDFPGLQEIFANKDLALWEGDAYKQVIWVPLLTTEQSGPLWVGRKVDPSPLAKLQRALEVRSALIILALLFIIWVIARWIAFKAEALGTELSNGLSRVVENGEPVTFAWSRPQELQVLGTKLTRLASTHAEHNTAMREYAHELEEANRYKSEFLANVSHELRTPLNSILLLSKLLATNEDNSLPKEQAAQADVIHKAGSDLMMLINNILDLSRIEAGKCKIYLEEIDLAELVESTRSLFQPQFDDKGLLLSIEIDGNAPQTIKTDGEKLGQILKNFLSNAVKFTLKGGVTLRLSGGDATHTEKYPVKLSVHDTGIGIPEDKLGLLFEAFEQADSSTSRRYGGTGLGLTISRELARLLGGCIEVESTAGEGSTFSLFLPLEINQSNAEPVRLYDSPPRRHNDAENSGKDVIADFSEAKVLIVDDDVRNLLALTPVLERWKINVTGAGDGHEALEVLREDTHFDLVLMDIMMPDLDGYETIRRIRALPHLHDLVIIALTAKVTPEDRQKCLEAGATNFITKPVDIRRLKTLIGQHLKNPSGLK